jgi:hypothetical protein
MPNNGRRHRGNALELRDPEVCAPGVSSTCSATTALAARSADSEETRRSRTAATPTLVQTVSSIAMPDSGVDCTLR